MKPTFWDKRSKRYDENIKKHDSIYEKTINKTKSLLTDSDTLLDFACASGVMSLDLAPNVQRVHGIDLLVPSPPRMMSRISGIRWSPWLTKARSTAGKNHCGKLKSRFASIMVSGMDRVPENP